MFTYAPNSFQPISKNPSPSPQRTPNYKYLYHSSFCPRAGGSTDLTQSVCVHPMSRGSTPLLEGSADRPTFLETVQVVPESSGGYRVLRPGISISNLQRQPSGPTTLEATHHFSHNIGSSDMQKRLQDKLSATHLKREVMQSRSRNTQRGFTQSHAPSRSGWMGAGVSVQVPRSAFHESLMYPSNKDKQQELLCSCKLYHSHTFKGRPVNREVVQETRKFIDTLTSTSKKEESREDNHDDLRNIFWTPSLSFHPFCHGDKTVRVLSSSFTSAVWFY